jgi:hypothetical protein
MNVAISDSYTWERPEKPFKQNIEWSEAFPHTADVWAPLWIEDIDIYSVIRFHQWGKTCFAKIATWQDKEPANVDPRSVGGTQDAPGNGIAYEWWIDLCNRSGADLWLQVPHLTLAVADFPNGDDFNNDFLHKLAILVRHGVDMGTLDLKALTGGNFSALSEFSQAELIDAGGIRTGNPLRDDLFLYLEYSNETWLGMWDGHGHALQQGEALGLPNEGRDAMFHAWAAVRCWRAFHDVFGDARKYQVVNTLAGTWGDLNVATRQITEIIQNPEWNPWGVLPDAYTIDYYAGYNLDGNSLNIRQEYRDFVMEKSARHYTFIAGLRELLPGLRFAGYEGGNHVTTGVDAWMEGNDMYEVYMEQHEAFGPVYTEAMCHYVHVDNGHAFSAKSYVGQPADEAPKFRAIRDWGAVNPAEIPGEGLFISVPLSGATLSGPWQIMPFKDNTWRILIHNFDKGRTYDLRGRQW